MVKARIHQKPRFPISNLLENRIIRNDDRPMRTNAFSWNGRNCFFLSS
ncbi:hypothetical protein BSM4216_2358 [Bacillus smithii]|nr:hypothetical protein BSM4216_2358 [Bacillus smithii]